MFEVWTYHSWGGATAKAVGTATGFIGIGIQSGRIWYKIYKDIEEMENQRKITNDPNEAQWNQWQSDNGIMSEGDLYGGN
ncbi:MAG: hypothetical protein K9H61_12035 [Bacteroidia bacterium]|nr:hypothetical protein [Bacteroidia bacterium]MCF8447716.1 hypothetical protein [Bacteroidia bacterium]